MSDISRIRGPSGNPEPVKRGADADADKFKRIMKVEKVDETSPDNRGRKRRAEDEDEDIEATKKAVNTPLPSQIPTIGKIEPSPVNKQPRTTTQQPAYSEELPSSTPMTPFAEFNTSDIEPFAYEEEESFPESLPPPPSQGTVSTSSQQTSFQGQPSPQTSESEYFPSSDSYSEPQSNYNPVENWQQNNQESEPSQNQNTSSSSSSQSPSSQPHGKKKAQKKKKPDLEPEIKKAKTTKALPKTVMEQEALLAKKKKPQKTKAINLLSPEEKRSKKAQKGFKELMEEKTETTVPTSTTTTKTKKKTPPTTLLKKSEEISEEAIPPSSGPAPHLLSPKKGIEGKISGQTPTTPENEELIEEVTSMNSLATPQLITSPENVGKEGVVQPLQQFTTPILIPGAPVPITGASEFETTAPMTGASAFADLHPDVLSLFERLVGVMTVMQTAGIKETTMTLSEQAFSKSPLFGSTITIRTYDTAPREMNLEFSGSQQALAMMENNAPALFAAFQAGGYNFIIKRVDFKVGGTERPLFKRKGDTEGKQHDLEKEEKR